MSPIGIFGGTFDPIHYGHLRTAFEMLQALRFGELRFVPSGDPPHRGETYAPASLRLDMVRAATANEPQPEAPMGLILGMDAFLGLADWHRWNEILDYAHIVVAHRPGWRAPDIGAIGELISEHGTHRIDDLHEQRDNLIYIHAVTQLEISSTEIRDLVGAGRDPRFLMPDVVRDIIVESNCYEEK
jgi:nicotinate-nucleotide adenylyltransferase